MVYRNNNLKKEVSNEVPTYPFAVDVPSFPERKYLVGIYRFARITYIALFIAMIFCIITIFRAFSLKVSPRFIKWNNLENRFQYVNFSYDKKPSSPQKDISFSEYLNEYFVTTYISKKFSISENAIENYNNWCNCNDKKATKMGMLYLDQECYLCFYSTSQIYSTFTNNLQNAYNTMFETGITRTVDIIDINMISGYNSDPTLSMIEWFLNKTKPIIISRTYRVDFIVNEFKDKKLSSKDVLIAYIEISGNEAIPQLRTVVSESYMFNPNYDLILKDYTEEANAE